MENERGGIIVWVFIVMLLFAALSFTMMRGSRTSGSMVGNEEAKAHAAQIIAYGNDVKNAVKRMTLRGIKEDTISFANTVSLYTNGNPIHPPGYLAACTNSQCEVFNPQGGGITPRIAPEEATQTWSGSTVKPGSFVAGLMGNGLGLNDPHIIFRQMAISEPVCRIINTTLGVAFHSGLMPLDSQLSTESSACFRTVIGAETVYHYDSILFRR